MFWKSARKLAEQVERLASDVEFLSDKLELERKNSREKGRLASELLSERDAARIERDTAQRERDTYREDAVKHRNSQAANQKRRTDALNRAAYAAQQAAAGDGGSGFIKPNGTAAAVQGVV